MIIFSTEDKIVAGALDKLKGFYIYQLIFLNKIIFLAKSAILSGLNNRARRAKLWVPLLSNKGPKLFIFGRFAEIDLKLRNSVIKVK